MFDRISRVQKQTTSGNIQKYHGETEKMIEQRIRAKLPDMGKDHQLDIHHSGNIVAWQATRLER